MYEFSLVCVQKCFFEFYIFYLFLTGARSREVSAKASQSFSESSSGAPSRMNANNGKARRQPILSCKSFLNSQNQIIVSTTESGRHYSTFGLVNQFTLKIEFLELLIRVSWLTEV